MTPSKSKMTASGLGTVRDCITDYHTGIAPFATDLPAKKVPFLIVWIIVPFLCFPGGIHAGETRAESLDVVPFHTRDQGPFSQVFGLPPTEGGKLVPAGRLDGRLVLDIANSDSGEWLPPPQETLELDGETLRLTLALRYGLANRMEIGLDIPYVYHDDGVLDGFIDTFHDISGLPLASNPIRKDRLVYYYVRDGVKEVDIRESTSGAGDLLLSFGYQLAGEEPEARRAIAVRAGLKLPTGDAGKLRGSGGTDFSLRLAATDAATLSGRNITLYGEAGALWMGKGEVLTKQQRSFAGFGAAGLGWSPLSWLALKAQVEAHTAFYRDSVTDVLASPVFQVVGGSTFALPWDTTIDVGISENIFKETSPDVTFHFALRKRFGGDSPCP